jgi:hypothetical protein
VGLQNSFCGYIWHPVQESGWFCVDASVDERVDGKVDERVGGGVDGIGNAIVDAAVDG